ncbi:hypothetical protein HPB49_011616 [Dermacentor silvarum]|uniref:Uncharacterized protein n=1 Tax=Dermacentor silvarum TaxID=543639 RepID=A0ACB8DZ04_DERSI|nr:hypothetical protein HPB49_011616 [Dermacentor silvarum]
MTSAELAFITALSLIGTASCQFRVPLMLVESNWTSSFGRANTPIHERLENHMDMDYIGEVKLGTPGQTFRIIFDTGSADFWVPSVRCTNGCHDRRKYDPSHSSSHVSDGKAVSIKYGSGEVRGALASDTLHLGNGAVPAQPFAEITHASGGIFRPEPVRRSDWAGRSLRRHYRARLP